MPPRIEPVHACNCLASDSTMDALGGFALAGVTLLFAAFATAFAGLPVPLRLTVWTMSVSKKFAGMVRLKRAGSRITPALPRPYRVPEDSTIRMKLQWATVSPESAGDNGPVIG
jgi:hypothetical protein